jgi:uncharacterized protein (TIGR03435 family)
MVNTMLMPKSNCSRRALRIVLLATLAGPMLPAALGQSGAAAALASAASPDYVPTLTFDVATIRQSGPTGGRGLRVGVVSPPHNSTLQITNFTIKSLIQVAYGFGTPISGGGPDWFTERYYNVQAKSDPATDEKLAKLPDDQARLEKQHMLQVLLADRFGLKTHLETRESSIYELVVAKGGAKLQPTPAPVDDQGQPIPNASPAADVQARGGQHGLEFDAKSFTMKAIAGLLTSQVEAPVIDKTGLTGAFNFTLQIGREWSANDPESYPSIFTAIQEQLGLKLNSTKEAVPNLIIDHIQLPSEN